MTFVPSESAFAPQFNLGSDRDDEASMGEEIVLSECPHSGERACSVFRRLAAELEKRHATCVALFVYGQVASAETEEALAACFGAAEVPVTWVECAATDAATPLAGVQAVAWRGGEVGRIRIGGRVVGSVYRDEVAEHCWLGGIRPQVLSLPRAAQVQQMLGVAELALDLAGFALRDVVRTWFYNDDILAWYGDFNRVRTAHYAGTRWRSGAVPASTGIGAKNRFGAALEVAFRAWRPLREEGAVTTTPGEVFSPLQCPAPAYGSSFSRAMEVPVGRQRWLTVSGTASIHPDGRTAHEGDAVAQVDLTMRVVGAILASRQLTWADVQRATAYFRRAEDAVCLRAWLARHGLRDLPMVETASVVCRDDLLFEIEVDALT